jgi:ElaB/YqjD/DUF883 family membrane-anchored ribosome-binding protein
VKYSAAETIFFSALRDIGGKVPCYSPENNHPCAAHRLHCKERGQVCLKRGEFMSQSLKEMNTGNKGPFKGAVSVAEKVAKAAFDVEKLKVTASHAVEDGMAEAKRMVKKGRYAAEDMVEDTAHRIKQDPFRWVGVMFGAGLGLGIFAGWLFTYRAMKDRF